MENIIYERDYTQEVKEIRDKTYVRTSSVDVGRKLKGPNTMVAPCRNTELSVQVNNEITISALILSRHMLCKRV